MARKRKRNVSPTAAVAVKQQESDTKAPKPLPTLPSDIVQCIFDAMQSFEDGSDSSLEQQKIWITLSLVCKDWANMVIPHRTVLILPTARAAKRFNAHGPKLLAAGIKIRHFRHHHEDIPQEILLRLVPHVSETLQSLTIAAAALQSKFMHDLLKTRKCRVQSIHIGGHTVPGSSFWKGAYVMHRLECLTELKLSGLVIRGTFQEFQASVISPIKSLHLQNVVFDSKQAIEHLAWPLVYQMEHLALEGAIVAFDGDRSVVHELCQILGKKLRSLRILRQQLGDGYIRDAAELLAMVPVLEDLDIDGWTWFDDFGNRNSSPFVLDLPLSLQHCSIGPLDWETASAYLQRIKNPTFIPNLKSWPILRLQAWSRKTNQKEVDEHNQAVLAADAADFRQFLIR